MSDIAIDGTIFQIGKHFMIELKKKKRVSSLFLQCLW